MLLQGCW